MKAKTRREICELFHELAAQREAEQEGQAAFERACRAAPSVAWREVSSPLENAASAIRELAQTLGLDDLTFPVCIELAKAAGVEAEPETDHEADFQDFWRVYDMDQQVKRLYRLAYLAGVADANTSEM